jgi:hypothetical protein
MIISIIKGETGNLVEGILSAYSRMRSAAIKRPGEKGDLPGLVSTWVRHK